MSQNNNTNTTTTTTNHSDNSKNKEVVDQNGAPEKMKRSQFPAGLRVLIVDDDATCLKLLNTMLLSCQYRVTQTTKATEALELLRKNKGHYDIVITDVVMPDMDGFELLRIIGLEMDIPVIMMSAYDETSIVMKGVRNGARDYLVKPLGISELRNIWQHVMRKTIFDPNKSSSFMIRRDRDDMETLPLKKRRDRSMEIEEIQDNAPADDDAYAAAKKTRFVWTPELHTKFVDVVQQLDADKAVPKKILEVMSEPLLTREIIASHLQKYRNLLRKKQDDTSGEGTSNAGFNFAQSVLNSNSPTFSDNADLINSPSTLRQANSLEGVLSLRDQLLSKRPDALLNEGGLMLVPLNHQQNLMPQQNMNSPLMPDQVLASNNIPLLDNVAQGSTTWVPNPSRMMLDNYMDMASQIPNFSFGQLGDPLGFANFGTIQSTSTGFPGLVARQPRPNTMPMAGRVPHPPGPGAAAFNGVRAPNHIPRNASNQFSQIPQPNSIYGQREGRGLNVMNWRTGSNFRGGSTSYQAAGRTPVNTHGTFTQLLTNPNDIEDDDVQAALEEFIKTSAPTL